MTLRLVGRLVSSALLWVVLTVIVSLIVEATLRRRLPVLSQIVVVCLLVPALVAIWRPRHGR